MILILTGIAGTAAMGMALTVRNGYPVITNRCNFIEAQPNVQTQCDCFGTIKILSDQTMVQYEKLQATLGLNTTVDNFSCDPRNVAVLLLSSMDTALLTKGQLLDRYVMNLFYLSSGGPKSWKRKDGWLDEERDVCTWYGVACQNDRISKFELSFNGVDGTLISELGLLDSLTDLILSENPLLTGAIPREIGNLAKLKILRVRHNGLFGTLPSELSRLTNLLEFSFAFNTIIHGEPLPIWNLSNLMVLEASSCGIMGSIPSSQLALMTGLTKLDLDQNMLTNTIPSAIGKLTNLVYLYLGDNHLRGVLPSTIGYLDRLITVVLHLNALTGKLPTEIGLLTKLAELSIRNNRFSGTLPSEIGNCVALEVFACWSNFMSGTIPDDALGHMANLELLDLRDNDFSGFLAPDSQTGLCELRRGGTLSKLKMDCPSKVQCKTSCCTECTPAKGIWAE
jgi:Leucine-rich repeat (LRR) protein